MTALCGGGTSSPISPQTEFLNLTAGAIQDLLVSKKVNWYATAASGLGYLAYNIFDLCATDPPPWPNIDAARFFSYFASTQGAYFLRQDATDIIANLLWRDYCKCDNQTLPPPVVIPPAPPGIQVNPPTTTAPTDPVCKSLTIFEGKNFDTIGNIQWDWSGTDNFLIVGAKWMSWTHNGGNNDPLRHPYPVTHTMQAVTSGGVVVDQFTYTQSADIPSTTPVRQSWILPDGVNQLRLITHTSTEPGGGFGAEVHLNQYCTAAPPNLEMPCCPPDPTLENLIIQVLQNEQLILALLGGKKAYTRGPQHGPLTGEGTIAVTGLFGVQIEITQGTPTDPLLPGVPPYQFSVGWISMITPDGMIDEVRITRQLQVWASELAPYASSVGYHVNPGFTINVRELLPA
jgi:hypothetical protein